MSNHQIPGYLPGEIPAGYHYNVNTCRIEKDPSQRCCKSCGDPAEQGNTCGFCAGFIYE